MAGKIYDLDINPDLHRKVSFAKSAVRIVSCGLLAFGFFFFAGLGLAIAEVLGVVEEIV